MLVYVDDLVIRGSSHEAIEKINNGKCFHMKDLVSFKYFLDIEVARGEDGLFLSQQTYTLDIISGA